MARKVVETRLNSPVGQFDYSVRDGCWGSVHPHRKNTEKTFFQKEQTRVFSSLRIRKMKKKHCFFRKNTVFSWKNTVFSWKNTVFSPIYVFSWKCRVLSSRKNTVLSWEWTKCRLNTEKEQTLFFLGRMNSVLLNEKRVFSGWTLRKNTCCLWKNVFSDRRKNTSKKQKKHVYVFFDNFEKTFFWWKNTRMNVLSWRENVFSWWKNVLSWWKNVLSWRENVLSWWENVLSWVRLG